MRALLLVVVLALFSMPGAADERVSEAGSRLPMVAIIIDDLGYNANRVDTILSWEQALTLSFLPDAPLSPRLSRKAALAGNEVMLHMPMEAGGESTHHDVLHTAMNSDELTERIQAALRSIPDANGLNNHRGSMLTADERAMRSLMQILKDRGNLYFVDSRTTKETVAERIAREYEVPTTRRRIFLDNERDPAEIRRQFDRLIDDALIRGYSLGIAHPHPETLQVLAESLPELQARGCHLVPVSTLIENSKSRRNNLWHVSLSR